MVDEQCSGVIDYAPSGVIARVNMKKLEANTVFGFKAWWQYPNGITGIPTSRELIDSGDRVLVSTMVLDAIGSEYAGLAFAPDSVESAVRDANGQVLYVL